MLNSTNVKRNLNVERNNGVAAWRRLAAGEMVAK